MGAPNQETGFIYGFLVGTQPLGQKVNSSAQTLGGVSIIPLSAQTGTASTATGFNSVSLTATTAWSTFTAIGVTLAEVVQTLVGLGIWKGQ